MIIKNLKLSIIGVHIIFFISICWSFPINNFAALHGSLICILNCNRSSHLNRGSYWVCVCPCVASPRRWRSWSREPTRAALQTKRGRSFWTAHACWPASYPTSSRTPTGGASSGPTCPERAEPGWDVLHHHHHHRYAITCQRCKRGI